MIKLFEKSITMGLPRFWVFYCLPILYFVNLTNLSIEFPIDYNKEINKMKQLLGGFTNPEEREQKLLQIAVEELEEERQRADEERQRGTKFLREIGAIKHDKDACLERLREERCGGTLKFEMELFGVDQLVNKRDKIPFSQGMQDAMEKIHMLLWDRRHKISNHVYALGKLYEEMNELSSYSVDGFLNSQNSTPWSAWSDKVKEQFKLMQDFHINRRSPIERDAYSTINLSDFVIDFNSATNDSDAIAVFRMQCHQCFWSMEDINRDETTEINKLAVQWSKEQKRALIPEMGIEDFTFSEDWLLRGILNTGRYFTIQNENYEHCTKVFYFGHHGVDALIERIEPKWGKMCFEVLVDKFCFTFATLYNAVSGFKIHGPLYVPKEYEPTDEDYQQFFKDLAPNPKVREDYIVIARTLWVISS